ncbi:hypothetical protein L5515_017281 [Caenorhabditis briggsae]|uniref:Uncharacterized protein n=1 Tax=Caenorhabditis briggsae TaxID=6238 RepID=A0AAE9FG70_CAEBR|nr:hypothetical protein L5515_017281 [Caenorhabditis briggsae]
MLENTWNDGDAEKQQNDELERVVERHRQNWTRLNEQERRLNENLQFLNQIVKFHLPPWSGLSILPSLPKAPLNERK